jgi:hypothetical protein
VHLDRLRHSAEDTLIIRDTVQRQAPPPAAHEDYADGLTLEHIHGASQFIADDKPGVVLDHALTFLPGQARSGRVPDGNAFQPTDEILNARPDRARETRRIPQRPPDEMRDDR